MTKDPLDITGMHNGASSRVFKNATKLRSTMTVSELKLWKFLKAKPEGFKFRRQHPIGKYILDFYCHKLRLSIELDGGYHMNPVQNAKDAERTAYLNALGITELRFSNNAVLSDFENWKEQFNTVLRESSPFRAGERAGNTSDKS